MCICSACASLDSPNEYSCISQVATRFLNVTAPFHFSRMENAEKLILEDVKRMGASRAFRATLYTPPCIASEDPVYILAEGIRPSMKTQHIHSHQF